jgi:hypothetical protein
LEKLGLNFLSVVLGEVTFQNTISQEDKIEISKQLEPLGFKFWTMTIVKKLKK